MSRWDPAEISRVLLVLEARLDTPYEIGSQGPKGWVTRGKPSIEETVPKSFDCSGLSRWAIGQGKCQNGARVILPHGTLEQIKACTPVAAGPVYPLDLGFADLHGADGAPDHVIIRFDDTRVIEARGAPYDKVIFRPVEKWEAQKGFMGWWRAPGIYG